MMIKQPDKAQRLLDTVEAIWEGCGEIPPKGTELRQAADQLAAALKSGRKIPRTFDKTASPLSELTRYIEDRMAVPIVSTLPRAPDVTASLPPQSPRTL